MDHRKEKKSVEPFKKSSGCGDSFVTTAVTDRSLFGGKFIKIPSVKTGFRSCTRRASIRKTQSCLNIGTLCEPKYCKLKRAFSADDLPAPFRFIGSYGRRRGGILHGDISRTQFDLLRETRAMKLSARTPEEEVLAASPLMPAPPLAGEDGGGTRGSRVANYPGAPATNPAEHRASLRAALLLMLAAWRTCRVHNEKRNEKLQFQVTQLSLQISLLRQLNNTESQRAATASAELMRSRSLIEVAQKRLEELKQEQENEKAEAGRRERRLEEQTTVAENLRNDLIAVRQDFAALESQLNREREKLSKEREDKKVLIDKVQKAEAAEAAATILLESVCNESRNREEQLNNIQKRLDETIQENQEAKTKLLESEKQYAEALETVNNLREQTSSLKERLACEEAVVTDLQRSVQLQIEEIAALRAEVEALTQAAANSRPGTLCISLLRIPLALLQAIHFISHPFNRSHN